MLQLPSDTIQDASVTHLRSVQNKIVNEATFELQVKKAESTWKNKNSGRGRAPFVDIKSTLKNMCIGIEICVYCEQNEATDIEHIYPKKLYPEKAFSWENYVLACGKCNTHHKSDKFSIFHPANSTSEVDITPPRGIYVKPPNDDALFINQRTEDPMELLELDLVLNLFVFTEKYPPGTREYKKAAYTKDLLGLNTRGSLVANRKNAAHFFISRLEKYCKAKSSTNFRELILLDPDNWGHIDQTLSFMVEKHRIMEAIKKDLLSNTHRTVWKELIRQRLKLPRTNSLLDAAPEALSWM